MRRRLIRAIGAGIAVVLVSGLGEADASVKFVARLQLTSHRPNRPTGATLHIVWPSDGPGGKPKPEAKESSLPAGTKVNEKAVPTCTASDTQLKAEGSAACSSATYLGPGMATVITGLGPPVDPFGLDDRWFHAPGAIVAVFTARGAPGPTLTVNRVEIKGATFIARLSLPPGYPPGTKTVPKQSDQIIDRRVSSAGAFITTPPSCPKDGKWISRATSTYDDGSTDTATNVTPCKHRRHPDPSSDRGRDHDDGE